MNYPFAPDATRERLRLSLRQGLRQGMGDRAAQFHSWLAEGQLKSALAAVAADPAALADLLPIVADPDADMNVRLGAGAVFERHAGSAALERLLPALGKLSAHADRRVRADACHLLGLSGSPAAIAYLEALSGDPDAEVREIAADSLQELKTRAEPAHQVPS